MLLFEIKNLLINNTTIIIIVGIAYLLDFITGISKAVYKHNIQSKKLRKSVGKGLSYFAYIIIGACLQILFPMANFEIYNHNYDVFIYITCLYIIITEFISVNENTKQFASGIPIINKFLQNKKEELEHEEIKN